MELTNTESTTTCPDCVRIGKLLEMAGADDVAFSNADSMTKPVVILPDTFAYACADAEPIEPHEVDDAYGHWKRDGSKGLIVWVAKKRNMRPVVEVCEMLEQQGIALPPGLEPNPENTSGKRW